MKRKIGILAAMISLAVCTPAYAYTDTLGEREVAAELYNGFMENRGNYSKDGYDASIGMHLHNYLSLDYFPCENIILEYRWDTDTKSQTIGVVTENAEEVIAKVEAYNKAVNDIVSSIPEYITTDREKAIYLNNKVVSICEYDHYYDKLESGNGYQALIEGKSICGGYAQAYYNLCTAAGIKCRMIYGFAGDTCDERGVRLPDHAYNSVLINGEWLYVDTTWNDSCGKNEYLLVDSKTFSKTHEDVLFYENELAEDKITVVDVSENTI